MFYLSDILGINVYAYLSSNSSIFQMKTEIKKSWVEWVNLHREGSVTMQNWVPKQVLYAWICNYFQLFLICLEIRMGTWLKDFTMFTWKTMLASRWVSFYETIAASSKLCIRFLSNLCKMTLTQFLAENYPFIANDCFVNLSDQSKMLVKKQMKYFDVPMNHARKLSILY